MQTSFEIQLVWNQVRLLDLLELVDQGKLGLGGDWGPLGVLLVYDFELYFELLNFRPT